MAVFLGQRARTSGPAKSNRPCSRVRVRRGLGSLGTQLLSPRCGRACCPSALCLCTFAWKGQRVHQQVSVCASAGIPCGLSVCARGLRLSRAAKFSVRRTVAVSRRLSWHLLVPLCMGTRRPSRNTCARLYAPLQNFPRGFMKRIREGFIVARKNPTPASFPFLTF